MGNQDDSVRFDIPPGYSYGGCRFKELSVTKNATFSCSYEESNSVVEEYTSKEYHNSGAIAGNLAANSTLAPGISVEGMAARSKDAFYKKHYRKRTTNAAVVFTGKTAKTNSIIKVFTEIKLVKVE